MEIKLYIEALVGLMYVVINANSTILELKEQIYELSDIDIYSQTLVFSYDYVHNGQSYSDIDDYRNIILENSKKLKYYNIRNGNTIKLYY